MWVSMSMPPPVHRRTPPRTLAPDPVPQKTVKGPAQGDIRHVREQEKGGIGGVPTVRRYLHPNED